MDKQNTDFKSKLEEGYDYYQKGEQQKSIELFDQVLLVQQQNSNFFRTGTLFRFDAILLGFLLLTLLAFSSARFFDISSGVAFSFTKDSFA